jgi:hypothetical protein
MLVERRAVHHDVGDVMMSRWKNDMVTVIV